MHYMYRNNLFSFAKQFTPAKVKFRCGIETFDANLRNKWNKGISSNVTVREIAQYFNGVCLLCGTKGESKERIIKDIKLAKQHFEYISINLFNENSTAIAPDKEHQQWFISELYPKLKLDSQIEILINNNDLGVGWQTLFNTIFNLKAFDLKLYHLKALSTAYMMAFQVEIGNFVFQNQCNNNSASSHL